MKPVLLLVEGAEDKHVVREILIRASAGLLDSVEIKEEDGLAGLLARLPAALKEEGRGSVGALSAGFNSRSRTTGLGTTERRFYNWGHPKIV